MISLSRPVDSLRRIFVSIGLIAWLIAANGSMATTGPAPPQGPGTAPPDHPTNFGTAEIDLGSSLFVDDGNYCRYVTNSGPALPNNVTSPPSLNSPGTNLVIDIYNPGEWKSFRTSPGEASQIVCCRPKTISLCNFGGATPVPLSLPYTAFGQTQTPTQQCTDEWHRPQWVGACGSGQGSRVVGH